MAGRILAGDLLEVTTERHQKWGEVALLPSRQNEGMVIK
jgi:hypothetical protein